MVDTGLIAQELRARGYRVDDIISIPSNAGEYEFRVDDIDITLAEARALLENPEHVTLKPRHGQWDK
jgi:hypothetical protein